MEDMHECGNDDPKHPLLHKSTYNLFRETINLQKAPHLISIHFLCFHLNHRSSNDSRTPNMMTFHREKKTVSNNNKLKAHAHYQQSTCKETAMVLGKVKSILCNLSKSHCSRKGHSPGGVGGPLTR
ncbi:hypothetical protein CDAR_32831 [Caerostris darwini]|uniref:Uncharacterized protein n=1 Tax=Caerostris darwini TaxID=1538125 RepID=A0AAV4SMJ0_9ARAC|nr:hypothetical protein CDAR_32831 [Caerostris darwini]